MNRETLTSDEFFHATEIFNLLDEMEKTGDWNKSENIRQVRGEIQKLNRFCITIERNV